MTQGPWLDDIREMLVFFTRLPVRGPSRTQDRDFTRALRAAPVAGLAVGAAGGGVFALAQALGDSSAVSAVLAITAMVVISGGLHEDALADVADGFGGGATRDRKLEIMRDSRVGSYGVTALVLVLGFKILAVAEIAGRLDTFGVACLLAGSAALSRGGAVALLHRLPAARNDGLSHGAGQPDDTGFLQLLAVSALCGGGMLLVGTGFVGAVAALIAASAAVWGVERLALAQIGGHTGDVAGFGQQMSECAILFAVLAAAGH